ncbi:hypothetical protein A8C32_09830 [Flavivirga aquatica]|uniref:Lysozyme n=1 Tax=Flavivirga aquatica TaxID=1849968 RepID=A0A1E5TEL3_9FLAO|nr:glycoside hydrolase family protein [Flavivirga aquatica]OEK09801.1 hypothetical protein A8C32_09830 [Flavivirga aquatica]
MTWEKNHEAGKEGIPRNFYLKEKNSGEEFPRSYYVANPNKTEEENKKSSQRIRALMLKVAKELPKNEAAIDSNNAVVLGEELTGGVDGDCKGRYCIRQGAESKLIQEINIRLAGFGGNVPTKKFTVRTVTMVKQFQKDYMGIEPTGNICGSTLKAIDEFEAQYPINFDEIKCKCGKCTGFGKGRKSEEYQKISIKERYRKYEYPGIHRSLVCGYRASLFYVEKHSELNYTTKHIESGYRCHDHPIYIKKGTTNHCGKALDIHYNYNGERTRSTVHMEEIRKKIFNKYLGAKWDWALEKDIFYLESTSKGARTWIHVDVREFSQEYLTQEFFVKNNSELNSQKIVDLAKEQGYNEVCQCIGLYASNQVINTTGENKRVDPKKLQTSDKGIQFIKDWESFRSEYYNDSEGYCTIGYGHLIGTKKCENIIMPDEFKNGITEAKAVELFKERLIDFEKAVQRDITVNLYQYEFDALVSLLFNTGSQFLNVGGINDGETKIKKYINNKEYTNGANEMSDVTNGGTRGIEKRRQAEINMFKNNIYDSTH